MNHRCGPGECREERCPARRLSTRAGLLMNPGEVGAFVVCGQGKPGAWRLSLLRRCSACPGAGMALVGVHDLAAHEVVFAVPGPSVNSTVVRFRRMLEALR